MVMQDRDRQILSINAHNGPGAGSCSSVAVSHAGFDRSNGPSSADGSCSASSHLHNFYLHWLPDKIKTL